jgi:GDPmannose 4,6-dehydratase
MPRALITGITGQDGLYLGALLAAKGYEVYGLVRGQSNPKIATVEEIIPSIELLEGDLRDLSSLISALEIAQPDEVYNLGAISFVGLSWKQAEFTGRSPAWACCRSSRPSASRPRTTWARSASTRRRARRCTARSARPPQRKTTAFHPRSPYGVAKAFGHYITVNYRESYGAFACSGILFNHESPRRGHEFVTRKVTRAVARISLELQDTVALGNLDTRRDWGFAGDYVDAMWQMLQQSEPDDFVIATGVTHSIRELLDVAFHRAGIDDWVPLVVQEPRFFRPAEVDLLIGDATKARETLGWEPKVGFQQLIETMVDADLQAERTPHHRTP